MGKRFNKQAQVRELIEDEIGHFCENDDSEINKIKSSDFEEISKMCIVHRIPLSQLSAIQACYQ